MRRFEKILSVFLFFCSADSRGMTGGVPQNFLAERDQELVEQNALYDARQARRIHASLFKMMPLRGPRQLVVGYARLLTIGHCSEKLQKKSLIVGIPLQVCSSGISWWMGFIPVPTLYKEILSDTSSVPVSGRHTLKNIQRSISLLGHRIKPEDQIFSLSEGGEPLSGEGVTLGAICSLVNSQQPLAVRHVVNSQQPLLVANASEPTLTSY